ncbi:hypothetical protein MNBD_ALPHA09-371 [hydrothermal vent metagenome]|uniref:Cytochrome c domain-containing protein n=1 Tax=hydrothermal vent metagenome TaxID=652676 RepID=A0A3B0T2C5_9ZZZZ
MMFHQLTNKILATITALVVGFAMSTTAMAGADEGSMARGGKLYDKWYKVLKVDAPKESHKLYPADKKYADKPGANWRCKECHGWDGLGRDGAYATGKHASGIVGINGMIGADPAAIIAIMTSEDHGYGDKLNQVDLTDLANFVAFGQVDMALYIDPKTKAIKGGDAARGKPFYETLCITCHAVDGKLPKDMTPLGGQMGNPWEVIHKILNGQPAEGMPALRALDRQITVDVMAYITTLPKE